MRVWVTRDKNEQGRCTCFTEKPLLPKGQRYWDARDDDDVLIDLTPMRFKAEFKVTPRKGSCKQMELTLKEIE